MIEVGSQSIMMKKIIAIVLIIAFTLNQIGYAADQGHLAANNFFYTLRPISAANANIGPHYKITQNLPLNPSFHTTRNPKMVETEGGLLVELETKRFPDGELYVRILNTGIIEGKKVMVEHPLDSVDDLVEIVLLMDTLRMYGAKYIQLILDKPHVIANGLYGILRYYCDSIAYREGEETIKLDVAPAEKIKDKKTSVWVDMVLYHHSRLKNDAQNAALPIKAKSQRIEIDKAGDNPLLWKVSLPEELEDKNVVLIHGTENSIDVAELWIMLAALRQAHIASISLINTYEGYSRQDKIFKSGEGVSAVTMLKMIDALVDNHMALNVHYGDNSGWVELGGYKLYNLNAFVQVAEKLFDVLVKQINQDNINLAEHLKAHPILLIGPDDGAFSYVGEASGVLKDYIQEHHGLGIDVYSGYLEKERISGTQVKIKGGIYFGLGEEKKIITTVGGVPISECWVFVLDDETSHGSTLLSATYVLVRELRVRWQRVFTGVVHGKLARGLEPFETGWSRERMKTAEEPKANYINEEKRLMPPRLIVTSQSVTLLEGFPEEQTVGIGPLVSHAVKRIVGIAEGIKPSLTDKISISSPRHHLSFAQAA